MNEGEMPVSAHDPTPRKSDRTSWFIVIALVLGLVTLIAFNMR